MSVVDPYSQYLENQVKTATPGKLLIMTFDGAIRFARLAQEGMKERKLDEQSANIKKVQHILVELMSTINHRVDRQLGANLDALYTYMFDQLTEASIHDDMQALEEVIQMLTELRASWAEAELAVRAASAAGRGSLVA